ncbi:MAG: NUDIX domain-containing protein [Candidatus Pacebacteria bacterium]|nr:NUDIX domain-containing protein [Candidatus Paceibacterota bacterium]
MPIEKSAGAVVFYKGKEIEYLLLHYPGSTKKAKDYWDFPKGHIEEGESEIDTVKREVYEETGLKDIEILPGFKTFIKYFFQKEGKKIFKIVVFYLAEAKTKKVKISPEHIEFLWLPFEEAIKKVAYKNAKEVLKKAHQFIKGQ